VSGKGSLQCIRVCKGCLKEGCLIKIPGSRGVSSDGKRNEENLEETRKKERRGKGKKERGIKYKFILVGETGRI